jgi:hypothetical protein
MTRDKDFKRIIRLRMKKTGESYSSAKRAVLATRVPGSEESSDEKRDDRIWRRPLQPAEPFVLESIRRGRGRCQVLLEPGKLYLANDPVELPHLHGRLCCLLSFDDEYMPSYGDVQMLDNGRKGRVPLASLVESSNGDFRRWWEGRIRSYGARRAWLVRRVGGFSAVTGLEEARFRAEGTVGVDWILITASNGFKATDEADQYWSRRHPRQFEIDTQVREDRDAVKMWEKTFQSADKEYFVRHGSFAWDLDELKLLGELARHSAGWWFYENAHDPPTSDDVYSPGFVTPESALRAAEQRRNEFVDDDESEYEIVEPSIHYSVQRDLTRPK